MLLNEYWDESYWYISSDGSITIRGKADKGYYQTCTGCWLTA